MFARRWVNLGAAKGQRDLLRLRLGDDYEADVEAEARSRVANDQADVVLLNAAQKMGAFLLETDSGFASIPGNPKWNRVLQSILQEQGRFLESKRIDPQLIPKIQAALDRVDPEGAKVRAAQDQAACLGKRPSSSTPTPGIGWPSNTFSRKLPRKAMTA